MTGTEIVPETSVAFNHLTRLITAEYFINVGHHEILRSIVLWTLIRTGAVELIEKDESHQEIRIWLALEQRSFSNNEKVHCDENYF